MRLKPVVKQPAEPEKEVSVEVLATAIEAIAQGVRKLRSGRLKDRALLLLIHNACPSVYGAKPSVTVIQAVFEGIDALERTYLK